MEQLRNWDINLTDEAGNLLQSMLQLRPQDRPTLAQALEHPWVTNNEVEIPQPSENVLPFC
jgi:serine/threonine protein kinase